MKKDKLRKKMISLDFVRKLMDENIYLKNELNKEKIKLANTMGIYQKEIATIKEDNRILNLEIANYLKKTETIRYTILDILFYLFIFFYQYMHFLLM